MAGVEWGRLFPVSVIWNTDQLLMHTFYKISFQTNKQKPTVQPNLLFLKKEALGFLAMCLLMASFKNIESKQHKFTCIPLHN